MTVVGEAFLKTTSERTGEEITEAFTTEIRPAPPVADDLDEEAPLWTHLPEDRPTVQLGQVVNPPKVCGHPPELVAVEPLVAKIEDDPPRWEIRVKALCTQCGVTFAVEREGHPPRDGSSGTVLSMHPASDPKGS